MFVTKGCNEFAKPLYGQILTALTLIQQLEFDKAEGTLKEIQQKITKFRSGFTVIDVDELYNDGFVLSQLIQLFLDYTSYWRLILNSNFPESWSALQDVQDRLRSIYRNTEEPRMNILRHIENQCGQLEQLYPYKIFFSSGFVEKEAICSICGNPINGFECEHIKGKLYRGVPAYSIIKKAELSEVSMVLNPSDKRCTVQLLNTSEKFNGVGYLANGIKNADLEPLSFGHLNFYKIRKLNQDMSIVGRNVLCPCGSGKKYKKCCLSKAYIETTHVEIVPEKINLERLFHD